MLELTKELTCQCCRKKVVVKVPLEGYLRWRNGLQHIQDAMPQVSEGDREMLVSGICESCFDGIFKEDE